MFKNLQKDEENWTEEDHLDYLQTKMEELALKESEVNDKGVVQIAGEDSKEKSQEPTKQTEKQKKKRLNKNEISQTKLTKFFKINKD